ncbi:MAG: protein tyrosine phosphatase [Pseudomonadota bacterium]
MTPRLAIRVGGLHTIDADLPSFRPTHLIGILDPPMPEPPAYRHVEPEAEKTLLRFVDSESGVEGGPEAEHVQSSLEAIERALRAAPARLFIHCHAGASRSTATAYLALACQHGAAQADTAFAALLAITNKPWPNRRIVQLADEMLGAKGRLLEPLDAYRAANPRRLRAYVRLHWQRAQRDPAYAERLGMSYWPSSRRT